MKDYLKLLVVFLIILVAIFMLSDMEDVHAEEFTITHEGCVTSMLYCNETPVIEASHYSALESGNPVGFKDMGSVGTRLHYGDIAMPYSFPAWTQIVLKNDKDEYLKDNDGNVKIFTNTDRGSKSCIRLFNGYGKNKSVMRIDLFMENVTMKQLLDLGLSYYKMEIIRWGKDKRVGNIVLKQKSETIRMPTMSRGGALVMPYKEVVVSIPVIHKEYNINNVIKPYIITCVHKIVNTKKHTTRETTSNNNSNKLTITMPNRINYEHGMIVLLFNNIFTSSK